MRLFECPKCRQPLYFENTKCLACGCEVGYSPRDSAMKPVGDGALKYCANSQHAACNWLLPSESEESLCKACRLNNTIPDLSVPENVVLWRRVEVAKRRLIYGLLRFGLPIEGKSTPDGPGLQFDFVKEGATDNRKNPVTTTGHDHGIITINIDEANHARREENRQAMAEPYRTLLGHFRHEIGHYYWDTLIAEGPNLEKFRELFGNETIDYGIAMKAYYANGPQADWQERFISAYASSHAWEDWAETWAHHMHITATLETASEFGISTNPRFSNEKKMETDVDFDPYREPSFDRILKSWLPLTYALNSLNRSMGFRDLYPFELSGPVTRKLAFIHDLLHASAPTTPEPRVESQPAA